MLRKPIDVGSTLDASWRKLEDDLRTAASRLRQMGVMAAADEPGGAMAAGSFADEVDEIQVTQSREIGFAARELLIERVNRLRAALDRLREGEYGHCVECGEPIAPARLRAMPEVETCVRCQARRERAQRQLDPAETRSGGGA